MKVEKAKSFLRCLSRCSDDELRSVAESMRSAAEAFGRPHLHTGVDIRRLGKNLFECRTGIHLRLLFESGPGVITFVFAGYRGEVQANFEEHAVALKVMNPPVNFPATND